MYLRQRRYDLFCLDGYDGKHRRRCMRLSIFCSYSHRDEDFRDELERQLSTFLRRVIITGWHNRRIGPGEEWRGQIDSHLRSAQIILLLVSADFLASDYCSDIEIELALERHAQSEAVAIPIIVRPLIGLRHRSQISESFRATASQ